MKAKLKIKTLKGEAKNTLKLIKPVFWFILRKGKYEVFCNNTDDIILFEIECDLKEYMKLNKVINSIETFERQFFDIKVVKKIIYNNKVASMPELTGQQQYELMRDLIHNQTKIEIVKEATAREIVEYNKTFWEKLKEGFENFTDKFKKEN